MTAINFPDSPTTNDEFTAGGRTWIWDGTVWNAKETTVSLLTATAPLVYDTETNNLSLDPLNATAPLEYDAETNTISLDPAGLSAVQDNYILTLMSAI